MELPDLRQFLGRTKTRQFVGLFSSNVLGVPVSFVLNILLTSFLGAALYGDYQFIFTIYNTANILLNLGLFYAGNRAIVLCRNSDDSREFYGAMLFVILLVSLLMSLAVSVYALLDPNVAEKGMKTYLFAVLPFSGVFMLNQCFEAILQADNRIRLLSYTRLFPKIVFLVCAAVLFIFAGNTSCDKLMLVLYAYVFSLLSVYAYVYIQVRPSFANLKYRLKLIFSFEKSYGFNVYIGAVCAVGFAQLSDLLVSYFSPDNADLGFYKLSIQFSSPLSFIPMTLANTHFKEFSLSEKISSGLVKKTVFLSLAVLILLWACLPFIVRWFFKPEFQPVVYISMITSVGVVLYGLADFFNRYLAARGHGKILRNASFMLGPCVLLYGIVLIPAFGAQGAALAKICSGATYFLIMFFSYKYTIGKNEG